MQFDVRVTHNADTGRVNAIDFAGAEFTVTDSAKGILRVWLDDEACMDWQRVRTAVENEAAAEDADMVPEAVPA